MSDARSNHSDGTELERLLGLAKEGDGSSLDELLRRAKAGDRDALTGLVQLGQQQRQPAAHERLMTFARRHLTRAALQQRRSLSDDPESMAQSGILELLRKPPLLQDYTAAVFIGYLNRMVHNWAHDAERKRKLRHQTTLGGESQGHHKPPLAGPDPMPAAIARERLEFLLSRCPDEQDQLLLRKRFEESLAYEEIGRLLTPPRNADAVRMRITRILVRLGSDPRIRREND